MAVTANDARPAKEMATAAQPDEFAVVEGADGPAMVELVSKNTFHTIARGAAHGVTVTPGDRFHTPAPHAEDLKRQGLAADAPAEAEAEPQA